MKIRLIILVFILFVFNKQIEAQYDTVFFDIPELKVNNNAFLYDLDTMLLKFCPPCEEENSHDSLHIITIEEKSEYIYELTITKSPPLDYLIRYTKGFFKINNTCFFVKGILPEKPKCLFTATTKSQQFYYIEPVLITDDDVKFDTDGDCCVIILEYRYQKLLFLKRLW
ncbi:MAG: hypothetical protein RBS13_06600 [Bacteroidales bacterium]|jgi:hypothetical protein|nr:hypothetical protein [Bacteroidales bacterium]